MTPTTRRPSATSFIWPRKVTPTPSAQTPPTLRHPSVILWRRLLLRRPHGERRPTRQAARRRQPFIIISRTAIRCSESFPPIIKVRGKSAFHIDSHIGGVPAVCAAGVANHKPDVCADGQSL